MNAPIQGNLTGKPDGYWRAISTRVASCSNDGVSIHSSLNRSRKVRPAARSDGRMSIATASTGSGVASTQMATTCHRQRDRPWRGSGSRGPVRSESALRSVRRTGASAPASTLRSSAGHGGSFGGDSNARRSPGRHGERNRDADARGALLPVDVHAFVGKQPLEQPRLQYVEHPSERRVPGRSL